MYAPLIFRRDGIMRMMDLRPGDILTMPAAPDNAPKWGVFMGKISDHPLYPQLMMFIWRLSDDSYTFDALSPIQRIEPNEVWSPPQPERNDNIRWAIGMHGARKPRR